MEDYTQPLQALGPVKTTEELRILMIANNHRHNKRFHYLNPVHVKGEGWYVWFELKFESKVDPNVDR